MTQPKNSQIDTHIEKLGTITDYDYVTWYVSNAKHVAVYFCNRFGFKPFAYRGPENGSKDIVSHVIKKNDIVMNITCAIRAEASYPPNKSLVKEIHDFVASHGDSVKDIAFVVDDVKKTYDKAMAANAIPVHKPKIHKDKYGSVSWATIKACGDTSHTLLNRTHYPNTRFLPGYMLIDGPQPIVDTQFGDSGLIEIDHCVSNQGWEEMASACKFYEEALGFHQFWSVDETQICTKNTSLKSTVMASSNEKIKMPVNEPGKGKMKSQIEEFIEYNNGPGFQHLAYRTENIIQTVEILQNRGVEFIKTPDRYYQILKKRLDKSKTTISEDLDRLKELNILVDFDERGYLLQLFTRPLTDRPTFFIEIIQRENHNGFGAGNFLALFESIERDQIARGTS